MCDTCCTRMPAQLFASWQTPPSLQEALHSADLTIAKSGTEVALHTQVHTQAPRIPFCCQAIKNPFFALIG